MITAAICLISFQVWQVCALLLGSSVCTAEHAGSVAKPQAAAQGHSAINNRELQGGTELLGARDKTEEDYACLHGLCPSSSRTADKIKQRNRTQKWLSHVYRTRAEQNKVNTRNRKHKLHSHRRHHPPHTPPVPTNVPHQNRAEQGEQQKEKTQVAFAWTSSSPPPTPLPTNVPHQNRPEQGEHKKQTTKVTFAWTPTPPSKHKRLPRSCSTSMHCERRLQNTGVYPDLLQHLCVARDL